MVSVLVGDVRQNPTALRVGRLLGVSVELRDESLLEVQTVLDA